MNKYILAGFALLCTLSLSAQLERVVCEVVYKDDGSVPGYPEGYTTYRIYAEFVDSTTFLTSVFTHGCHDLFIGCENDVWQHPQGAALGSDINKNLLALEPLLQYDSFVTIGMEHSRDAAGSVFKAVTDPLDAFDTFEEGKDLYVRDGAWGSVRGNQNGSGKRVLLAQITTSRPLSYRLNLQVLGAEKQTYLYHAREYTEKDCENVDESVGTQLGLNVVAQ